MAAIPPPSVYRISASSDPEPTPIQFKLDRLTLCFVDKAFESTFLGSRRHWLRKVSIILGPVVCLFSIVYLIQNYGNEEVYPKVMSVFRFLALFSSVPPTVLPAFHRIWKQRVLYVCILIMLLLHTVTNFVAIKLRKSHAYQQEIYLSLLIMSCFVLRVFLFRHVVWIAVCQALLYGIFWITNTGPYTQSEFAMFYVALCSILGFTCYSMERREREAFALLHKMELLSYHIATMDLDACDQLRLQSQSNNEDTQKSEEGMEEYLWTMVNNLKDFRPYLPQALLRSKNIRLPDPSKYPQSNTEIEINVSALKTRRQSLPSNLNYVVPHQGFAYRQVTVLALMVSMDQPPDKIIDTETLYNVDQTFIKSILPIIVENQGVTIQFGGGWLLATWNGHTAHHQHVYKACKTALYALQCARDALEKVRKKYESTYVYNIYGAITTGPCAVGIIGTEAARSPVVMGEPVDLATQLVKLNKSLGSTIVVSQGVYETTGSMFTMNIVDYVHPPEPTDKSNNRRIAIYELHCLRSPTPISTRTMRLELLYKDAFIDFAHHRFGLAQGKLEAYLSEYLESLTTVGGARRPSEGGEINANSGVCVRHALRLLRLSIYGKTEGTIARPYRRRCGWQELEREALESSVDIPDDFNQLEKNDYGTEKTLLLEDDLVRRASEKVREQIIRTHGTGSPEAKRKHDPYKAMNDDPWDEVHSDTSFSSKSRANTSESVRSLVEKLQAQHQQQHQYPNQVNYSENTNGNKVDGSPPQKQIVPAEQYLIVQPPSIRDPQLLQVLPNSSRRISISTKSEASTYSYSHLSPAILGALLHVSRSQEDEDDIKKQGSKLKIMKRKMAPTPAARPPEEPSNAWGKNERHIQEKTPPHTTNHDHDNYTLISTIKTVTSEASDDEDKQKSFLDYDGNHWQVGDIVLGAGAFGSVNLGMGDNGCLVAIKQVNISFDPKGQNDMLNEIRLLSTIRHDNIVAYLGSAVVGKKLLIIMEYVACGSLAYILQHFGALAPVSVSHYSRYILRGLSYLHQNHVVHRDIKPPNVLLDESGRCKLADFGTAGYFTAVDRQVKGTPMYMAPEAVKGHANEASDIWSFGATTLELLTGRTPWQQDEDANPFYLMECIANSSALPEIPETLPANAIKFVHICLQRNPTNRPSAVDLLEHAFLL